MMDAPVTMQSGGADADRAPDQANHFLSSSASNSGMALNKSATSP
jgi:hypothetical protein